MPPAYAGWNDILSFIMLNQLRCVIQSSPESPSLHFFQIFCNFPVLIIRLQLIDLF